MSRIAGLVVAGLAACLAAAPAGAQGKKKYADLNFLVVKKENGKPVRNASVVLHLVDKKGRQESGGFQLKTDREGKANFPGAPYGKLRIQVIARGFQTFGEDFDISQPKHEIVVQLNPPKEQHSIYTQADGKEEKKEGEQKTSPQ